jgi:hypothetical protein
MNFYILPVRSRAECWNRWEGQDGLLGAEELWRPKDMLFKSVCSSRCVCRLFFLVLPHFCESSRNISVYPTITYYWTVPLILDHSYLFGNLTNSKIDETKALEPLKF